MKRKAILILLSIFIYGCSTQKAEEVTSADVDDFGYAESYNRLSNTEMGDARIIELQDELLFLVPNPLEKNKEFKSLLSLGRSSKKDNAITRLENQLEAYEIAYPKYYGGYLYYLDNQVGKDGMMNINLMRMDLDGTNAEKVYELVKKRDVADLNICLFSIHQNYIYFSIGDTGIRRIHIKDYTLDKKFNVGNGELIYNMFFYDNTIYYEAAKVDDTIINSYGLEKVKSNVYKYDMDNSELHVVRENVQYLDYIDKENMIYSKPDEESTYMYNFATETDKKLFDSYSSHHFRYNDLYLIDVKGEEENLQMYLVNLEGEIIDQTTSIGQAAMGQGIFNDKYYVFDHMTQTFFYYNLKNDTFSEIKELKVNE